MKKIRCYTFETGNSLAVKNATDKYQVQTSVV